MPLFQGLVSKIVFRKANDFTDFFDGKDFTWHRIAFLPDMRRVLSLSCEKEKAKR